MKQNPCIVIRPLDCDVDRLGLRNCLQDDAASVILSRLSDPLFDELEQSHRRVQNWADLQLEHANQLSPTMDTPPRQMSLIPYPYQNGEVVLYVHLPSASFKISSNGPTYSQIVFRRRGNAIVVYDAQSRQLSVRDASEQAVELADCPYCHRPLREEYSQRESSEDHGRPGSSFGHDRPYVDPEYFSMLAASQRGSPSGSAGPSTPAGRVVHPALRSGRSRDVSGTQEPPTGAEFVGSEPVPTASGQGISSSAFSPGYFKQFFREIRELGRGGYGVVTLVEHIMDRVSLGQFACKRVPVGNDHGWLEKVLVEVKLLQKIPHKNLVAYHWVWLEDHQPTKFGPSIPCLWILQEFCNGGDLHSYVLGPNQTGEDPKELMKDKVRRRSKVDAELPQVLRGPSKLTFDEIFSFFRDITSGLHHLHTKGYIHRDLKPSNCLIQQDGTRSRVLLSDFGEVQAAGVNRGSTGATGTISYCAPEVLKQDVQAGTFGNFTTKSDIFSLGMIVYFMCFGRLPYSSADDINEENEDLDELRAEIMKWPGFDDETRSRPDLPEKLYKYLKRLLSVDPNERPSTDEILASIKGGAGLGDVASVLMEENSSRVSAIDSPKHRPSPQGRRPTSYLSRPGLSSLGRHTSADNVRSRSPTRRKSRSRQGHSHAYSHSTPTSPIDGSMVMRPGKIDLPPSSEDRPPQQSPRLMLPAPPARPSMANICMQAARHPNVQAGFQRALFLGKLISLLLPCSPFAPKASILYPLLGLAALDLGFFTFDVRRTLLLLGLHITAVVLASRQGRLCEGTVMVWDE